MPKLKKILGAVFDGTFPEKTERHLVQWLCGRNRSLETLALKCRVRARLERDYRDVLEEARPGGEGDGVVPGRVWTCWLQGMQQAPDLVQACIESMRRNMPDREIVVVTEDNLGRYLRLPGCVSAKWAAGKIPPAHYSDIIRCALLCRHGGTWCDATVLCTAPGLPAFAAGLPLFAFREFDLARTDDAPILASSWFLSAARPGHPILETALQLLYAYWQRENALRHYFLFHLFFAMAARRHPDEWARVPRFNNHGPHTLMFELGDAFSWQRWEQILAVSDIHKLNRHLAFDGNTDTFYRHVLEEYLPRTETKGKP